MSAGRKIPKCIVRGCDRPQVSRGLCGPCNQAAMRKIRKSEGRITWKDLEDEGLALPLGEAVRSNANPIAQLIDKKFGDSPAPSQPTP